MKTESNIKPTMVERYPGLVRVNFAVDKKTVRDSDGSDDRTMYTYQMIETKELPKRFDELFALLYYDRYPVDVQVHTLASGTQSEIFAIDRYRRECVRTAKALLDIPYTLDEAKDDKIAEITAYDASEAVNSFWLGGTEIWLSFDERARIRQSIDAYRNESRTEMTKWFGGKAFTFTLDMWQTMLDKLSVYASEALNVTEWHKVEVRALTSIEAVEGYDYKTGYPEKLSFANTSDATISK